MHAGGDGDDQLGADAVRTRNQYRIGIARRAQVKQSPETAKRSHHSGALRAARQGLHGLDECRPGVYIDSGVLVAEAADRFLPHLKVVQNGSGQGSRR